MLFRIILLLFISNPAFSAGISIELEARVGIGQIEYTDIDIDIDIDIDNLVILPAPTPQEFKAHTFTPVDIEVADPDDTETTEPDEPVELSEGVYEATLATVVHGVSPKIKAVSANDGLYVFSNDGDLHRYFVDFDGTQQAYHYPALPNPVDVFSLWSDFYDWDKDGTIEWHIMPKTIDASTGVPYFWNDTLVDDIGEVYEEGWQGYHVPDNLTGYVKTLSESGHIVSYIDEEGKDGLWAVKILDAIPEGGINQFFHGPVSTVAVQNSFILDTHMGVVQASVDISGDFNLLFIETDDLSIVKLESEQNYQSIKAINAEAGTLYVMQTEAGNLDLIFQNALDNTFTADLSPAGVLAVASCSAESNRFFCVLSIENEQQDGTPPSLVLYELIDGAFAVDRTLTHELINDGILAVEGVFAHGDNRFISVKTSDSRYRLFNFTESGAYLIKNDPDFSFGALESLLVSDRDDSSIFYWITRSVMSAFAWKIEISTAENTQAANTGEESDGNEETAGEESQGGTEDNEGQTGDNTEDPQGGIILADVEESQEGIEAIVTKNSTYNVTKNVEVIAGNEGLLVFVSDGDLHRHTFNFNEDGVEVFDYPELPTAVDVFSLWQVFSDNDKDGVSQWTIVPGAVNAVDNEMNVLQASYVNDEGVIQSEQWIADAVQSELTGYSHQLANEGYVVSFINEDGAEGLWANKQLKQLDQNEVTQDFNGVVSSIAVADSFIIDTHLGVVQSYENELGGFDLLFLETDDLQIKKIDSLIKLKNIMSFPSSDGTLFRIDDLDGNAQLVFLNSQGDEFTYNLLPQESDELQFCSETNSRLFCVLLSNNEVAEGSIVSTLGLYEFVDGALVLDKTLEHELLEPGFLSVTGIFSFEEHRLVSIQTKDLKYRLFNFSDAGSYYIKSAVNYYYGSLENKFVADRNDSRVFYWVNRSINTTHASKVIVEEAVVEVEIEDPETELDPEADPDNETDTQEERAGESTSKDSSSDDGGGSMPLYLLLMLFVIVGVGRRTKTNLKRY